MQWDVHYVEQTGSTNTDLLAQARHGAAPGRVLWAGHQTGGRGRLGRQWEAPPGAGLLASVLLAAEAIPFLSVARVALAAADACYDLTGLDVGLKWPNDLLVGERKLAGLLAEADLGSPTIVIGIGCNVTWPPPGSRTPARRESAVALSDFVARPPAPAALLDGLLARLDPWLLVPDGLVFAAYRARCATLGREVTVQLAGGTLVGMATGVTLSGELQVASSTGTQVVQVGDVVHVRAN